MAQLSTTMSQAHKATAFHFLTSKRFLPSGPTSAPPDFADFPAEALDLGGADGPASGMSTSAMLSYGLNMKPQLVEVAAMLGPVTVFESYGSEVRDLRRTNLDVKL